MIKKTYRNTQNISLIKSINKNLALNFIEIKRILRKGDVRVNEKRVKEDIMLLGGEEICCFVPQNYEVVFEDENVLIVNKFSKIETISQTNQNDLLSQLKQKYSFCKPCNRLDTNTNGINVFALNENAFNELNSAFRENRVEKIYYAIVYGKTKQSEIFEDYLVKDEHNAKVKIYSTNQKDSVKIKTEYRQIESINEELNLVEIKLHTGKTHQIRAHMAFKNLPILGDRKYGNSEINKKYKKEHQCLTSFSIAFDFNKENLLYYLSGKQFHIQESIDKLFKVEKIC